jgi:predicted ester cyclase
MGKIPTGEKVELNVVIYLDILKNGKITDHWNRKDFM